MGAGLDYVACGKLEALELRLAALAPPRPLLADTRRFHRKHAAALDPLLRRRADVLLGRAALRAGAYREAVKALERSAAWELSAEDAAELYRDLARAYDLAGDTAKSVEFLRRATAEARSSNRPLLALRLAIYLICALVDLGDLVGAYSTAEDIAPAIASSGGQSLAGSFHWAEAYLASAAGLHLLALVRMRHAIDMLMASGADTLSIARAHLMAGEHGSAAGRPAGALKHLETAGALFQGRQENVDFVIFSCETGRLAAAAGRADEAEACARSALARLGDEEESEQGRARWILALAYAARGQHVEAISEFEQASEALAPTVRYTVRIQRDWARSLSAFGRHRHAAVLLAKAAALEKVRRLPNQTEVVLGELTRGRVAIQSQITALESRLGSLEDVLLSQTSGHRRALALAPPLRPPTYWVDPGPQAARQ